MCPGGRWIPRLWIHTDPEPSGLNLIRWALYLGYVWDHLAVSAVAGSCRTLRNDLEPDRNRVLWLLHMTKTRQLIQSFSTIPGVREGYCVFHDISCRQNTYGKITFTRRIHGDHLELDEAAMKNSGPHPIQLEYEGITITRNNVYFGATICATRNDRLSELLVYGHHRPTPWLLDFWGDGMWYLLI